MAHRHKNQHLLLRRGRWYINKRLPGRLGALRQALGTSDVYEARERRDTLLRNCESVAASVDRQQALIKLREQFLSSFRDEERAVLEDSIIEQSEELASELGVWDAVKANSAEAELTEQELKPIRYWKTATGRLTPFSELLPGWLASIENKKTRSDYRRTIEVLSQSFVATEELSWEKARAFIRSVQEEQNVSSATLRKWISGYINFWDFYDRDTGVWRNHKLKRSRTIAKRAWTTEEVRFLHGDLVRADHWLQHPVWIAAHTGARLGAICDLVFYPQSRTVLFPAKKREEHERVIPAHPAIIESLNLWVANKRSASSVGGRFGEFKTELGFGPETDFHSFRRTLITEFENLGCPESVTADIVGHKKQTITYGLYSGGSRVELMREWIEKLSY